MATRTWLTTPVGGHPVDDTGPAERWTPGPAIPEEPGVPGRYRGVIQMAVVLAVVVAATFILGPVLLAEPQDPTFAPADASG